MFLQNKTFVSMNDSKTLLALTEVVKYEHKQIMVEWAKKIEELEAKLALYESGHDLPLHNNFKRLLGPAKDFLEEWVSSELLENHTEEVPLSKDEIEQFYNTCSVPWLTRDGYMEAADNAISGDFEDSLYDNFCYTGEGECREALKAILAARNQNN